jgi:hypothetical protein
MNIDSARELKERLMTQVVEPLAVAVNERVARERVAAVKVRSTVRARAMSAGVSTVVERMAVAADEITTLKPLQRTIALGIAPGPRNQFRLAIRVQRPGLLTSKYVEEMVEQAKGEADVRFIGRVVKRVTKKRRASAARTPGDSKGPWYQSRMRPLQPGVSIGHWRVTAGTLGCFVKRENGDIAILSNNHVLANEDAARAGDAILQQGRYDGGRLPADRIGSLLSGWVRFRREPSNTVDAALASIDASIGTEPSLLRDVAGSRSTRLAGVSDAASVGIGAPVHKVGRTTGATTGRISAFELDDVTVSYRRGNFRFDGQIEIQGGGDTAFSDGGDSGSLIVDGEFRAFGLLFAGTDQGGTDGLGLTFANPIRTVLDEFGVELFTG